MGSLSFSQGNGSFQPKFNATGFNSAYPAIEFGTRGGHTLASLRSPTGGGVLALFTAIANNMTVVATVNTSATSTRQMLWYWEAAGSPIAGWGVDASANKELLDYHAGGADIVGSQTVADAGNKRMYYKRKSTTGLEFTSVNGVTSINTTDGADMTGTGANVDQVSFGLQTILGSQPFNGCIAEVIVWPGQLDVDAAYRAYSAAKWGA